MNVPKGLTPSPRLALTGITRALIRAKSLNRVAADAKNTSVKIRFGQRSCYIVETDADASKWSVMGTQCLRRWELGWLNGLTRASINSTSTNVCLAQGPPTALGRFAPSPIRIQCRPLL
jgi:hypothetical protein